MSVEDEASKVPGCDDDERSSEKSLQIVDGKCVSGARRQTGTGTAALGQRLLDE